MLREFDERDEPNRPERPAWLRAAIWFGMGFFTVMLIVGVWQSRW